MEKNQEKQTETPTKIDSQSQMKLLIIKGKEQGYLTYAEINDHLPDDIVETEMVEDVIQMINDMGIQVYDEAPDEDTILLNDNAAKEDDDTATEEAMAVFSAVDSSIGRTTDPVRMYMREMGNVDLLSRKEEIAIAKRIERSAHFIHEAIAKFPKSTETLLEELAGLGEEGFKIADVIADIYNPHEEAVIPKVKKPTDVADDDDDDDEDEVVDTGLDPAEIKSRLAVLRHAVLRQAVFTPCRVTPSRVTPCRVTPCRVTPCRVTSCRVTPCRLTPCRVTTCRVTSCPCYSKPCYAMPCFAMPCSAMPCYAMPCYVMPCYAMPCYAMPCYAMLCYAMPCYAMPCYDMPCYDMPCYAMPC